MLTVRFVLCCATSLLAIEGSAEAQTSAVPVTHFLASLGVNTHVAQGYDYEKYIPALKYLGVKAVRDSTGNVPNLVALHQKTGVLIDIFNAGDLPGLLRAGRTLAAAKGLLSFEGANEPNNFPITYDGETGGGAGSWMPVANFQRDLYSSVKGDAALKDYPIFDVSEGGAEVDNVGMQWLTIPAGSETMMPTGTAYADYANVHNYVIGTCNRYVDNQAWQAAAPTAIRCWDGLFGEYGYTWRRGFPGYAGGQLSAVPRVTTETGWDSVSNPGGEVVQGKVLVNTYLAQYARGWRYTFIYELGDGEGGGGNQGLFHRDWSPKPAATYIHNLTSILADTGAVAATHELGYSIANAPVTVHDLLLQKSSGAFDLVVWGEQIQGSNDVVVGFGSPHAVVNVYDVTSGTRPVRTFANVNSVPLTLSDHAVVVEVMP
ncbi:glycosyl hydrolase [Acidisphaera sp. S103]|uniref:glycosyl hydrolase n=1 Tax=Acidisphaera sp. S103 TaxID=1747223 RepID=UPI00131C17CE|nr:glycosyl hydrolase [Acidisphaera sp. S103]